MPELLNHQHCRVCDRAVPVGEITCGDHAAEYATVQRKRKRTVMLFYVGSAVLLIVLVTQVLGPVLR
ncbi:MAG TPA: DUF2116 family Zn-ribbon domain-containing protein [Candidatus Thermoplasmatota archaeon]|nr:DUF2116 family Zn-ribbon domain-containing protein [Candidatus Thermoplasmatota archaeon]